MGVTKRGEVKTLTKADAAAVWVADVRAGRKRDATTLYAVQVLDGVVVAGPLVRKACERHLRDLTREDLVWDVVAAHHAIDFFPDMLVLGDGEHAGKPFELQLWQGFIVGSLFGWKGTDGYRRFRTAYCEIGKGNGKSPLAGGIGLYLLAADKEAGAEVYAAATKLDQAKILWGDAKKMVEASPILAEILPIRTNLIAFPGQNGIFKPISSEKRGLDGLRVHGGLIDELHEHADNMVVKKIRAGTKGRTQALILEITNSGVDKQSICYQHHEFSQRVLMGIVENDSWFAFICSLDEGDDWENDERCWVKSNPNLGISIQLKYLREQVEEAKDMPANRSLVERLNFCRWVGSENPWIGEEKWNACKVPARRVNFAGLRDVPCYLGLDLSSRKDLTALAAVWKIPEGLFGKVYYFTPQEGLEKRAADDRAPYDLWTKAGLITATPGPIVRYDWIAHRLAKIDQYYNVQMVAFDPWRIDLVKAECEEIGLDLPWVKHGQGFGGGGSQDTLWMPKSIELWDEAIVARQFYVEDNEVTNFCVANATISFDPTGSNRKWVKQKGAGRMDGTVALCMAVGAALAEDFDPSSVYEDRDLLAI